MPTCCCAATTRPKSPPMPRNSTARGHICGRSPTTGTPDALDADVVRSYWVGGPQLDHRSGGPAGQAPSGVQGSIDRPALIWPSRRARWRITVSRLRGVSMGEVSRPRPTIALKVLQDCRIRWGTVESVEDGMPVVSLQPLMFTDGTLALGEPGRAGAVEQSRRLADQPPTPGDVVSAHWDWACGVLADDECAALAAATQTTLDLVNRIRNEAKSMTAMTEPGGGYVDTSLSADLAAAALDLARRFHDGATLWVISPAVGAARRTSCRGRVRPSRHHGKRALPSVALVEPDRWPRRGSPAARRSVDGGGVGRRARGDRRCAGHAHGVR